MCSMVFIKSTSLMLLDEEWGHVLVAVQLDNSKSSKEKLSGKFTVDGCSELWCIKKRVIQAKA